MTEEQKLEKIAEENGFQTNWSVDSITSPIDILSHKWEIIGKWMTNGIDTDVKVELPNRKLTGLELWKYADELYTLIGDTDHRFIEDITLKDDTIEVFFGS